MTFNPASILLSLLLLLPISLPAAQARLTMLEIPGEYALQRGAQCPSSMYLAVASTSSSTPAKSIIVSNVQCTSGSLSFAQNISASTGDNFTRVLTNDTSSEQTGSFILGVVEKGITCGKSSIALGSNLIFFRPSITIDFNFSKLTTSEARNTSTGLFEFVVDKRYLVLKQNCVYRKIRAVEPETYVVRSRWHWLGPLLGALIAIFGAAFALYIGNLLHNRRVKTVLLDERDEDDDIHSLNSVTLPQTSLQYPGAYTADNSYPLYYDQYYQQQLHQAQMQQLQQQAQVTLMPSPPPPVLRRNGTL